VDSKFEGLGMSPEEIKKLKMKRIAKKRTEINVNEEDLAKGQEKLKYIEADAVITQKIIAKERPFRTRVSILRCDRKHSDFFRDIVNMVDESKRKEELRKKEATKKAEEARRQNANFRYNVSENQFWKERLEGNAEEFQIDTRGSFHTDTASMSVELPFDVAASNPPKQEPPKPRPSSVPRSPKSVKAKGGIPIIVLPSAPSSLISLFNVKDFLQSGEFVPWQDKKNAGIKKEILVTIEKGRSEKNSIKKELEIGYSEEGSSNKGVPYHVIDSTAKLTTSDWSRVVAVFVLGPEWQFKDWPWHKPVDIFLNVKGFHLKFDDQKVDANVKSWDVKVLNINKNKRYLDKTASLEFWQTLEPFIVKNKNYLAYN